MNSVNGPDLPVRVANVLIVHFNERKVSWPRFGWSKGAKEFSTIICFRNLFDYLVSYLFEQVIVFAIIFDFRGVL